MAMGFLSDRGKADMRCFFFLPEAVEGVLPIRKATAFALGTVELFRKRSRRSRADTNAPWTNLMEWIVAQPTDAIMAVAGR